jgi:hypothetical protein
MAQTLNDQDNQAVKEALDAADALVTLVIRGDKGQQSAALKVARHLAELSRYRAWLAGK